MSSLIPRCEHGVYSPGGRDKPSEYCSGCTPPTIPAVPAFRSAYEYDHWQTTPENVHEWMPRLEELELEEKKPLECPRCFAPLTNCGDDDGDCVSCGFGMEVVAGF